MVYGDGVGVERKAGVFGRNGVLLQPQGWRGVGVEAQRLQSVGVVHALHAQVAHVSRVAVGVIVEAQCD